MRRSIRFTPAGPLALAGGFYGMVLHERVPEEAPFTLWRPSRAVATGQPMAMAASGSVARTAAPTVRITLPTTRTTKKVDTMSKPQKSAPRSAASPKLYLCHDEGRPVMLSTAQLLAAAQPHIQRAQAERRAENDRLDAAMGIVRPTCATSACLTKADARELLRDSTTALHTGDHGRDLSAELRSRYGLNK